MSNNHLAMICGESSTGKSASLRGLQNQAGVMYLNTEANKRLPFPNKFQEGNVTDPLQVPGAIAQAETMDDIHTIVIDSLTFLMDQYESTYVLGSANTMESWGKFAQFFKTMMQQQVAASTKNVIFTAHTLTTYNEEAMAMETKVPVKGSLKNNGLEAYFSTIVMTRRVTMKELEGYESEFLNITEDEREDGFKYVFQTRPTAATVNTRIRSSIGMWTRKETFIDNNVEFLNNRLHTYYGD